MKTAVTKLLGGLLVALPFTAKADLGSAQRDALVGLYNNTGGQHWLQNAGWGVGDPCDNKWYGVTCNSAGTEVHRLHLGYNKLQGEITDLSALNTLRKLALHANHLTGEIPTWIGELNQLEILELNDNALTGSIPSGIGSLTKLQRFVADDNRLHGALPASLGQLKELHSFRAYSNNLSGVIPSSVANLTKIKRFDVRGNALTGEVPSGLLQWAEVESIGLAWNALRVEDATLQTFLSQKIPPAATTHYTPTDSVLDTQTLAPTQVQAISEQPGQVTLTWQAANTHPITAGGYRIEVASNVAGPYEVNREIADKSVTRTTLTGLAKGTQVYIRVRSVTSGHDSGEFGWNTSTVVSDEARGYANAAADGSATAIQVRADVVNVPTTPAAQPENVVKTGLKGSGGAAWLWIAGTLALLRRR